MVIHPTIRFVPCAEAMLAKEASAVSEEADLLGYDQAHAIGRLRNHFRRITQSVRASRLQRMNPFKALSRTMGSILTILIALLISTSIRAQPTIYPIQWQMSSVVSHPLPAISGKPAVETLARRQTTRDLVIHGRWWG